MDPTRSLFSEYLLNLSKPSSDHLGVLQCVARLPKTSEPLTTTTTHVQQAAKQQASPPVPPGPTNNNSAPPQSPGYPHVVVLPPTQAVDGGEEDDLDDDAGREEYEPHPEFPVEHSELGMEHETHQLMAPPPPPPPETTYTDESPETDGHIETEPLPEGAELDEESQRDYDEVAPGDNDNNINQQRPSDNSRRKSRGRIWPHLKLPKLSSIIPGRANTTAAIQRRVKRQSTITTVDGVVQNNRPQSIVGPLAVMIVRAIMDSRQQRLQQQQQQLDPVNLLDQLVFGAFGNILRQNVDDIPVRMANLGQLMSSLLTVLTVNNPMIMNDPLLMRARLNAQTPVQQSQTNNQDSVLLRGLETLLKAINAANPATNLPAGVLNDTLQLPRSTSSNEPDRNFSVNNSTTNSTELSEVDFVNRLNSLTVGETTTNGVKATGRSSGAPKRRKKRSIGTMLMFGPFSKYYMALMMHKLVKQQSNIVSQTIMSELVRRLVIPGVTSALTGKSALASYEQLLGQARSAFKQVGGQLTAATSSALGSSPVVESASAQINQQQEAPPGSQAAAQTTVEQSFDPNLFKKSETLTADCRFVDNQGTLMSGATETLSFNAQQLMRMMMLPSSLLASSLSNNNNHFLTPTMSVDQQGLSINLPMSQTSLTMPNLFTGAGQQALMRLMANSGSPLLPGRLLGPALFAGAQQASNNIQQLVKPHRGEPQQANRFRAHRRPQRPHPRPPSGHHHPPPSPYDWLAASHNDHQQLDLLAALKLLHDKPSNHHLEDHEHQISSHSSDINTIQLLELLSKFNSSDSIHLNSNAKSKATDLSPKDDANTNNTATLQQIQSLLSSLVTATKSNLTAATTTTTTTTTTPKPMLSPDQLLALTSQHKQQAPKLDSLDLIADRLLNETLSVWLKTVMPAPESKSNQMSDAHVVSRDQPDLRLAKGASDHLANSMGLLLKEIDSFKSSSPPTAEARQPEFKRPTFNDTTQTPVLRLPEENPVDADLFRANFTPPEDQDLDKLLEKLLALSQVEPMMPPPPVSIEDRSGNSNGLESFAPETTTPKSPAAPTAVTTPPVTNQPRDQRSKPREAAPTKATTSTTPKPLQDKQLKATNAKQRPSPAQPAQKQVPVTATNKTTPRPIPAPGLISLASTESVVRANLTQSMPSTTLKVNNETATPKRAELAATEKDNSGQPLNNLAMALNVMNMVLLNRRLVNDSSARPADLADSSSPPSSSKLLTQSQPMTLAAQSRRARLKSAKKSSGRLRATKESRRKLKMKSGTNSTSTVGQNDNHRTSSNSIRLHANLITLSTTSTSTTRSPQRLQSATAVEMPKYHFKPLTTRVKSAKGAGDVDRSRNKTGAEPELISDSDHAARWNDVLQHLTITS